LFEGEIMPTTWLDTVLRQTRRLGEFPYPHWAAGFLNNPIRRFVGKPGTVVDRLGLTGAERVLEVGPGPGFFGPGPGFFSTELARRLPRGRLELFDVQPEMLDNSRHSLDGAGCHNVGFHAGDACDGLPFPDGAFDVAFLAAVLGEVPDKVTCIRSLARVLRPGGLLVLVEAFPDPDRRACRSCADSSSQRASTSRAATAPRAVTSGDSGGFRCPECGRRPSISRQRTPPGVRLG
jgi:SAM-dependent methyltransferase